MRFATSIGSGSEAGAVCMRIRVISGVACDELGGCAVGGHELLLLWCGVDGAGEGNGGALGGMACCGQLRSPAGRGASDTGGGDLFEIAGLVECRDRVGGKPAGLAPAGEVGRGRPDRSRSRGEHQIWSRRVLPSSENIQQPAHSPRSAPNVCQPRNT